jgi:hypothetical protein
MPYEITPNINENSPRIEQPEKITIQLKEHQKAIIYQARKLEDMVPLDIDDNKQMITQLGIICDHVGAGKSFEVLGTIASSPSLNHILKLKPLFQEDNFNIYDNIGATKIDTNIIAVPHGVFKQWEDYIKKSTTLTVYPINIFNHLKNLLSNYKLDDLLDPEEDIDDQAIDTIIKNMKSHKSIKKVVTPNRSVRDTKYYRYLEGYYQNDPEVIQIMKEYGKIDITKLNGVNIILISASLYNELAFYLIKDNFYVNRLIFDEADSINIPNTLRINSIFYWFVTSSFMSLCNPNGVEKKVTDQKMMYDHSSGRMTLQPVTKTIKENSIKCNGFIKETFQNIEGDPVRNLYYLKNNDEFIEISFKLPEPIEHLLICRDNLQIKVLNGIVSNDVLMMLNAGDTDGAIGRLTCEKGSEDNIISVVTQRLEQKINEYKEELKEKQTKEYTTPKAKQEALERTQKKIQETRQKIQSIEERIKGVECCDICFDDINNPAVTGCCQNVFCFSCLAIAISGKNICPKCRDSLTLDKIMIIKDTKDKETENVAKSKDTSEYFLKTILDNSSANDKYTNFEKIIEYKMKYFEKDKSKRKILIFSEHEGSFNAKMIGILDKYKVRYSRIKGTSASINKTLREYRGIDLKPGDHEIDILLINSRYFGAGLNLQNSSDIIILHRQGADLLHQIIGRAQRIGRKDKLNVWKLYHNNEAYNYVE